MIKLLQQTVFFQAFGYLLQLIAFFIFARALGGRGQGVLAVFGATGQIITSFMWIGLPAGAAYYIAKENRCFLSAFKNCIKYFVPVFFSITLIIFLFPISDIPKINVLESYIPRLLIFVLLLSFFNIFQMLTLSLKKYLFYNLFPFGLGVVICIFSVLINLIPQSMSKLDFAITVYIISHGVMFVYGVTLFFIQGNRLKIGRKTLPFLEQFKVGIRNFISNLAGLLMFRLDLFMVGFFLTFKEVGVYSVALFSAETITRIPRWCSAIISPMVASNEKGHVKRTIYLFYSTIIFSIFFGLVILLLISIFPGFISTLLGKDFSGSELCLLLLLPRVIMQGGARVLGANLAGKGYPWQHPAAAISGLVSVVLLDLLLIPKYGIAGAAVASSIGFTCTLIIVCIGFYVHNITNGESIRHYSVRYIEDVRCLISTKILRVFTKQT